MVEIIDVLREKIPKAPPAFLEKEVEKLQNEGIFSLDQLPDFTEEQVGATPV